MRRFWRVFRLVFACCVIGVLLAGAGLLYLANSRAPQLAGRVVTGEPGRAARVVRDDWGVPHITADSEVEAYFALGYVMAQDRLFQMELARRVAGGTLAEVFGAKLVPVDAAVRAFRLRRKAAETFERMGRENPALHAVLDAFAGGINACISREQPPFEFAVLALEPAPFTPVDCLSVGALLPITFSDGLRGDPLSSLLVQRRPELDPRILFPGYTLETPVTVMETLDEAQAFAGGTDAETVPMALPPLAGLEQWLALLQPFSDALGPALGSNSWVLSGSKTKSGKPILANDPHIGFTNPSIWYEAHLKYTGFESYGYHLPLIPFPLLSHNRAHAWALTMFANDDVDLFVERFNPENPRQVQYRGAWAEVQEEVETINVRFGKPVTINVRVTPHGPVVTDFLRLITGYEGPDVSLSWIWQHLEYTDMEAFYRMGHAADYDAFADAVKLVTSPGLNVSYADAAGNIAWWAAGRLPIRPRHVNSKMLLDGASGRDEVLGYVPVEANPHLKNPACGYIVTANNLSTVKPVGEVPLLEGYWQPGDRAGRIEQLLEPRNDWTLDALKAVQFDVSPIAAPGIVAHLSDLLKGASLPLGEFEQAAMNALRQWDGRHDVDSTGAAVYEVLTDVVLRHAVADEMGEIPFNTYGTLADHWNFFKYFVTQPDSPLWDDVTTEPRESASDIVVRALQDTVEFLQTQCGTTPQEWRWGRLHTMEFKHPFGYLPLLGTVFNIGPFPSAGGAQIVDNMLYRKGQLDFSVIAGPSTRRLIDFGDIEHTLSVLPTGNSGNFMSPHYDDQAAMFMAGQYRSVRFTNSQVAEHREHVLEFVAGS